MISKEKLSSLSQAARAEQKKQRLDNEAEQNQEVHKMAQAIIAEIGPKAVQIAKQGRNRLHVMTVMPRDFDHLRFKDKEIVENADVENCILENLLLTPRLVYRYCQSEALDPFLEPHTAPVVEGKMRRWWYIAFSWGESFSF